jgi:hypothetical protein
VSGVIRPAGPLPARVYWRRRLGLVVVLCLLATVAWWSLGRFAGGSPAAGSDRGTSSSSSGGAQDGSDPPAGRPRHQRDNEDKAHHHKRHRHRPPRPTGACVPAKVAMVIDVSDVRAGRSEPIALKLTSRGAPACTLAITPDTLALRVTSGADVIWSSQDCPNALLARELVVRAHHPTVYQFDWNGYRSTDTCAKPGKVATPGGYWAEAALIGGPVHRAYFDVT